MVVYLVLTGVECVKRQSLLQLENLIQQPRQVQSRSIVLQQSVFKRRSENCAQFSVNGTTLKPRTGRTSKIFDFFLFTYEGELPVLDLRFAEMADELDGIFIVEADKDLQGHPRKLILKEMLKKESMKQYKDKIHVIEVLLPPVDAVRSLGSLSRETFDTQQKVVDMVQVAVNKIKSFPGVNLTEDLFIEGDVDEIISHEALRAFKNCQVSNSPHQTWPVVAVQMKQYYINFGWQDRNGWELSNVISPLAVVDYFVDNYPKVRQRQADGKAKTLQYRLYSANMSISGVAALQMPDLVYHSKVPQNTSPVSVNYALESFKSFPCQDGDVLCGPVLQELKGIIHQGKGVIVGSAVKPPKPLGWHVSWTLDAENTARKLIARAGSRPQWSLNLQGDELLDMTREKLAEGPEALIGAHAEINLDIDGLPDVVKQHPERFRQLLGHKLYEALKKDHHISEAILWPKL